MNFSIIIINYQTPEITRNCLNSIFAFCDIKDFEIILIDNASQDNSLDILKKEFGERIKIIENQENKGFAKANNQGAKIAQGKYLFFLNSDTLLKENILVSLLNILENDKLIGILTPRLLNKDGAQQEKAYGKYPKIIDLIFEKIWPPKKNPEGEDLFEVDWLSGAALIIRKDLFENIGAWNENFFMYFEDIDLARRVKKQKYKIMVAPFIKLTHLSGQSLKQNSQRRAYYYASQNYYFKKQHGLLSLLILKIIRFPYKLVRLRK